MADLGSAVLPGYLEQAFRDVLQRDCDREQIREAKEEKRRKKKKLKKDSKKDKEKKEPEEKRVIREGNNSLITFPNASCFSVSAHIRQFVKQQKLCDIYNLRYMEPSDDETSEEEVEEEKGKDHSKLPEVVGLGIRGVFTILRDVWQTMPELCLKVLREFLNILQGQEPAGLKHEPQDTTTSLFKLLIEMVSHSTESLSVQLSSLASACLISLVIALGDTEKILEACATLLSADPDLSSSPVKVSKIFHSLQASVQAVLLNGVFEAEWSKQGVLSCSLMEKWPLPLTVSDGEGLASSIASDGSYLYLHGKFGLLKLGSGYGNTTKGHVYGHVKDFHTDEDGWLGLVEGKLLFYPRGVGADVITIISREDLTVETTMELDAEVIGRQFLFSDGVDLRQIMLKKDGKCVLRKLTLLCSPVIVAEEKLLQLSQRSVLSMRRMKGGSNDSFPALYQDSAAEIVRMIAAKNVTAVQTASGKLLYSGNGAVFGISGKDVPKGEWKAVDLPDQKTRVKFVACDNTGSFSLIVDDKGATYFAGTNKKGESGEVAGGRNPAKLSKIKKINKLKDQQVLSCAASTHCSAVVTSEGKLFMFGNMEEDIIDKSTGIVTGLLGVPVTQVAMGRSHTCVLTQHGTVYTMGNNQYGQCGRNYLPPSDGIEEVGMDEESDESDDEEETPCASGDHQWKDSVCKICRFCGFCTGYGPNCCNEGLPGRDTGEQCGCGSGDSGCTVCGCCKVCGGEEDGWEGIELDEFQQSIDEETYWKMQRIRDSAKAKKDKQTRKAKKEAKKEKKVQFEGAKVEESEEGGEDEVKKVDGAQPTKTPDIVPLPSDATVMQISCGTFHTAMLLHSGEVYMFGNGNHGQLGQGNNKPCGHPVKVPLPGPATYVACGDNHTVVLLETGDIYTFGKHQEGQLGRLPDDPEDASWHMSPGVVPLSTDSCKPKWVSASGNQSFLGVEESLVPENLLSHCRVFASSECVGIVSPPAADGCRSKLVMLDLATDSARRMDGEDQLDLTNMSLCVDPEYDLLWGCGQSQVSCFNPLAIRLRDSASDTILSPSLCLPRSPEAAVMRSHAGLNLLFCLHTLATSSSSFSSEAFVSRSMKAFSVDDYHCLSRFNSQGGGWGYSHGSVEAFRFSPDQDILLGGFGLFGGRGNYSADIKVFELGEAADPEGEGNLVASGQERSYRCDRTKTFKLLFEKPVLLKADMWYIAYAGISSPSGASTDAGSSGQNTVTGPDKVTIKFRNSKRSNNGTDVGSGQIPELLYKIPEYEQEKTVSVQLLNKSFYSTVTPKGLQSLEKLLDWSWSQYLEHSGDEQEQRLSLVVKACLGLLSSHIREVFPEKGQSHCGEPDSLELAECVYHLLLLVQRIFSRVSFSTGAHLPTISAGCQNTFIACFHAFYPSPLLSWFALCHLLQRLDPSDVVAGFPLESILTAVLEALSSPSLSFIGVSYDSSISLQAALVNVEDSDRFPVLTSFMHGKVLEEHGHEELLSFTAVASKILALVSVPLRRALAGEHLPSSPVVEKAANFLLSRINELSLCSTYSDVARKNGLPLSQQSERKNKQHMSSARFTKIDAGLPSLDTTELVFSVNKPVLLTGFSILGGTCTTSEYQYNVSLMKEKDVLATEKGSYSVNELHDGVLDVVFSESVELIPDAMYKAVVEQSGDSYCVGSDGSLSVTGPESVAFSLHSTGTAVSNPETGTLNRFLYSSVITSSAHSVVNLSVHLASMLLEIGMGFLKRLLSEASCASSLEQLGSSFLFSSLLPATIAQLGPITAKDPKAAVDVMTLVQRMLPVVSAATNSLRQSDGEVSPGYSDAKLMHYANLDTDHPYKQACVTYYRVVFPERVHWMTMEFDPRSGFAQNEDKIADLLIPRKNISSSPSSNKDTVDTAMIEVTFEDIYNGFQLPCPAGLVLLPGNEVHIAVNTDTEYEKRDKNNHFGVKCKVIGYECSNDIKECLFQLEKELVSLGAMCAGSLLQEDISGPFSDELPVSSDPTDTDKADMRIVQAAGHEVLGKHSHLLSRGLLAEPPSLAYVFEGEIPVINNSHEQQFLQEFIGSTSTTPGGRLARWLQPDRSVDMTASDLEFTSTDTPLRVSSQLKYVVRTRDQDKKLVYVEGMNVEVKVVWEGASEDGVMVKERVDAATGVRRPAFKRSYNPTMLGTNHLYHSVSMMMPYSDYSFEELRFFAPKVLGHSENMAIQNNKDGTYTASWVPSTAGSYSIHICIEGSSPEGKGKKVIIEPLEDTGSQLKPTDDDDKEEEVEEEKVVIEKIKRKTFPGTLAQGVRVRSSPSLNGTSIGIIKPGDNLSYTEEISTSIGTWIKLTVNTLEELKCSSTAEGYALAYHKAKDQCYLEEIEPIEARHVVTETPRKSRKERQGGPGVYTVVQCGSAGHNLRSRPGMRGTPVGRLTKSSTVNIVEEEENDDGIWLKLATDSAHRYCDVESEAWTLAVHPSGRIFLALEGDDSFKATLPQSSGASLPTVFPTAASVFGTAQQSLFGTPLSSGTAASPAPPKFKFSGIKLAFGEGSAPSGLFHFSSPLKLPELKVGDEEKEDDEEDDKPEPSLANESPIFNIGVLFGEKLRPRAISPRRRRSGPRSASPRRKLSSDSGNEQVSEEQSSAASPSTPTEPQPRHALSPAIAECQRAVFAAFLWQEALVNDAIVSATYLKFNTEEREKREEGDKAKSKASLPPTLSHLVTLWDEISMKVIENSSKPFAPPEVPALAQDLLKRYEEEKKQVEKLKKDEKKSGSSGGVGGGGGSTNCELCDEIFPDPVTYHMKEAHAGCGRHASGWGYNSRGSYCSGWAGNCGDGGRGGSTWYLLCKDCHAKFMSVKAEKRKKITKPVFTPRVKTRKPGKPRSLPVVSAVQGMIKNSKFLLEVAWGAGDNSKRSTTPQHDSSLRQSSIPEGEEFIEKRLSLPRPSADTLLPLRQPYLLRSASLATSHPAPLSRTYSDSGEEAMNLTPQFSRQTTLATPEEASKASLGSSLMSKPSMALANLMYLRSKQGAEDKETGYGRVMHFVTRYHDLEGLRVTMKQAMRIAVLRACALEFLQWLLEQVEEAAVIHNVLWHFMSALSSHPMLQAVSKLKAKKEDDEEQEGKKDLSLGRHPLASLDGAGSALIMLRKQFHSLLQTIADTMGKLPVGSSAQQMALKCWCLDFQQADHSFLLQSKVFAGISEALSNMEDRETDRSPPSPSTEEQEDQVQLMEEILTPDKLKVSSNEAMMNSLTDGSTETFWESRDDARDKPRSVTATFIKPVPFFGAAVHVDNLKDAGQRVDTIKLLIGTEEDSLKEVAKIKLLSSHTGWKTILGPVDTKASIIRLEFRGVQKHVRVRQVQILAHPSKSLEAVVSSVLAQQKDCEVEALRLFRLLTSKVFGGLLSQPGEEREGKEETDSGPSPTEEEEASSTMVNLLFTKNHLSSLQKQVCLHIIDSVHTEATRIREEWKAATIVVPPPPPPPPLPPRTIPRPRSKEPLASPPKQSSSHDKDSELSVKAKGTDTYCYELLTMLRGLSQSEPGCKFLVEQSSLLKDLISLLHTASSRLQLQVCSLMRRILPFIKPPDFAARTGVTVLPPLGYSAIAEAVNSAATINHLGLLDCFLAVISKALSVQVKAKGRGSNVLQALTKESGASGVTLASLTSPKPVPGEGSVNHMRWYLHGSMDQEVAAEVVKLLKAMIEGGLKGQWREFAKSAVGQAVLHLTKITEDSRHVEPGIYSQTLWLCLAALCVINEEHAEALSSGQWLGQDGKPHTKPLCDNHDDGETKALILCDKCGNLCGECDRVLHYHQRTSDHQRQVFKEEEEAVKVDLHEGCGRIKLYWTMALADSRTLKGMVEFRDAIGGGGKGSCRFCGTANSSGMLAIGNVCADPECQERAKNVCQKTLACGHLCCGVKDEAKCLPCLQGCGPREGEENAPPLKQDADDMCMICYTEGLSCAPCIQLECGHLFHYECCHRALTKRWSGPRITFRFMFCSICENKPISHPHLEEVTTPLRELYEDTQRKCQMRLEYENQSKCDAISSSSSKFYNKPLEYAMWKYAYYVCYKCKKAYYGGEAHCAEQAAVGDDYDPTELVCPACSHTGSGQAQICPKHGTDFLEYKCRYCCSVAVYYCFGTTHFCTACHDDFQRLTGMSQSDFPQCPVGPRARPLSGIECPLHVKHPPTGEEFALGCGVCRNAQTF